MRKLITVPVIALLVVIGLATPAPAGNGDWYRLQSVATPQFCLDSNYAGKVYVLDCTSSPNDFQRWQMWFGGFTKNRETGLCLTLQPGWTLGTQACNPNNRYQMWHQFDGGWIRNPTDNACVTLFSDGPPGYPDDRWWAQGYQCYTSSIQKWYQQVF